MMCSRQISNNFIKAFRDRPSDFIIDEYCVRDKKTDYQLWIANGPTCYHVYTPFKFSFSMIDKFRLWRAVRHFKAWKSHDLLMVQANG